MCVLCMHVYLCACMEHSDQMKFMSTIRLMKTRLIVLDEYYSELQN